MKATTATATSSRSVGERAAILATAHSKDALAQLCRAAGWSGDDARTPKMMLARWLAEHEAGAEHSRDSEQEQGQQEQRAEPAEKPAPQTKRGDKTASNSAAIAQAIAAALGSVKLGVDTSEIQAAVKAEIAPLAEEIRREVMRSVFRVEVKLPDATVRDVGQQHKQFPTLLKMVASGCSVFLSGPAGSGKTTAAHSIAQALGLPFYFNGAIDSEYKLSGFIDAQGRIVSTAFRKAYTEGGVYLFDEVDSSLAPALLAFNAHLANGSADFPGADQPVSRHPDFRCIAAGNTWGSGATAEYVGRNRLDAAFLDRFVKLAWGYDEVLERAIAGDDNWTSAVQVMRSRAAAKGLKVVISPRASIHGAKLLAAGLTLDEVKEATVFSGLTAEQRRNLEAA